MKKTFNFKKKSSADDLSAKTGQPVKMKKTKQGTVIYKVTVDNYKGNQSQNFEPERPWWAQDLGDEFSDMCWPTEDF